MGEELPNAAPPEATPGEVPTTLPNQNPLRFVVGVPLESEDVLPTFANLIEVESNLDSVIVNLFYMSPAKISRILASTDPVKDGFGEKIGGVVRVASEPVTRLALSMNTAANLMVELYRAVVFGSPGLRNELLAVARERIKDIDRLVDWTGPPPNEGQDVPAGAKEEGVG
jgi:hypothetical protein